MIVKLSNSFGYQVSVSSINVTTSSGVSVTQPALATYAYRPFGVMATLLGLVPTEIALKAENRESL